MSTNNTYECTELNKISNNLYYADLNTPSCIKLSGLNTIIGGVGGSGGSGGIGGGALCPELSNLNNIIKNKNIINNNNSVMNNLNDLNIFNINLKIMDYSGGPIYLLLLIAIITNIFLAIPLTPVFIAGFLYLIILILILAMLCVYLIHTLLFQE